MSQSPHSTYSREQLKQISDSVGTLVGWDFSRIRTQRAPVPWDYTAVVKQFLVKTDCVLDTGTGGGEVFLSMAPYFHKGIGIDDNPEMIDQANRNRRSQDVANVDFQVMHNNHLAFPDEAFDIVLNRHSDVYISESTRLLRPKGYFLTQQVACRNTLNILDSFGWTPASFGDGWWQPVEEMGDAFERNGCRVVAKAEYDVRYWFCDIESLVFWLKAVPLPEPFDIEKHWQSVNHILQAYSTPQGIETNEHRELLIVEKK